MTTEFDILVTRRVIVFETAVIRVSGAPDEATATAEALIQANGGASLDWDEEHRINEPALTLTASEVLAA